MKKYINYVVATRYNPVTKTNLDFKLELTKPTRKPYTLEEATEIVENIYIRNRMEPPKILSIESKILQESAI